MEIHGSSSDQYNIPSNELPNYSIINSNVMEEQQQQQGFDFVETSLAPITSYSNKQSASNFTSCPFTTFSSSPPPRQHSLMIHSLSTSTDCCSTPKEAVFDPFAPGPDNLMLAPHFTKPLKHSITYVPRSLNFHPDSKCVSADDDDDDDETNQLAVSDDEDVLLEAVYQTLLKAIISKQAQEEEITILPPAIYTSNPSSPDGGFKTPNSAPLLNGIAETCPAAPLKRQRKIIRNINLGLCRQLEF